ncbi:hypothetical protein PspLS_09486 [Pyricularia sp. CBS 133598]|nr:hypothetical protein PspLS_09486 [Pyricularia sp. CBS 133598]
MAAASTNSDFKLNENGVPDFDSLPIRAGDPQLSAWGLYGASDELGFLNRQTDERVAKAAQTEIRTGVRIGLNWPLDSQKESAFFERKVFHQRMFSKLPRTVNDDEWTFNTQVSSQWDGLRHFGYQKEKLFYNGVTMEDIHSCDSHGTPSTTNGIHAWADKGIVGRAILVDFESWRVATGKAFDHFSTSAITLRDILDCLAFQDGTSPRFGDVLLIRSGWTAALATKSAGEVEAARASLPHTFGGVEQSEDVLRWIWDNFSAVAGDQPSFECWPSKKDWYMHEVLLAGWGCPIGELFDLERLAEHCKKERRWSFFVASEPCNVTGGVASPPNILAIF